jgi:hypothetical protein
VAVAQQRAPERLGLAAPVAVVLAVCVQLLQAFLEQQTQVAVVAVGQTQRAEQTVGPALAVPV